MRTERSNAMHDGARKFIERTLAEHPPLDPVCEFGSYIVPGQEKIADLRPLFKGRPFIGCDIRPGPGVDLVSNMSKTDFWTNSFGTIIAAETLEHVANFWQAIFEAHRILRPGGLLIITSVFFFPIHDYPHDYWRFTPCAFKFLLSIFSKSAVSFDGEALMPTAIYGWGIK